MVESPRFEINEEKKNELVPPKKGFWGGLKSIFNFGTCTPEKNEIRRNVSDNLRLESMQSFSSDQRPNSFFQNVKILSN